MWTSGLGVLNHSSKVTFKQRLLVYLTSPNFFSVFSLVMFYLLSLKDGLILWMCLLNECWGTLCSFLIWDKHYILFLLLDFWLSRLFCNIVILIQWLTSMTIYICKSPDQTKALWDIMKLEEERLKENKGMRQREFWWIPRKLLQTLQTLFFESNRFYVKSRLLSLSWGLGVAGGHLLADDGCVPLLLILRSQLLLLRANEGTGCWKPPLGAPRERTWASFQWWVWTGFALLCWD